MGVWVCVCVCVRLVHYSVNKNILYKHNGLYVDKAAAGDPKVATKGPKQPKEKNLGKRKPSSDDVEKAKKQKAGKGRR